jgi:NADPH:quinone reductase-like Zn-dependent oxidoreductase
MYAMRIHRYGGPEVLVHEECPRPVPLAGEVLVRVHAAGVNPIDYRTRSGAGVARYWKDRSFPLILGWDVSGVVAERADGVTGFAVGDEVFALVRFPDPGACYAEYVAIPAEQLARKPRSVDHAHAAALPLAALTAWQTLFVTAKLAGGQRLLVHAAAGGVGHLAVQLGKWAGAEVIGTASGRNEGFVRGLGADRFIDYAATAFDREARDVDVQLDTVGRAVQERAWGVMKKGGCLVSIVPEGGPLSPEKAAAHGVRAANAFVRPDGVALTQLAELVDAGKLRPVVEKTFAFSDIARAHEHVAAGHTRGKVVIAVV